MWYHVGVRGDGQVIVVIEYIVLNEWVVIVIN